MPEPTLIECSVASYQSAKTKLLVIKLPPHISKFIDINGSFRVDSGDNYHHWIIRKGGGLFIKKRNNESYYYLTSGTGVKWPDLQTWGASPSIGTLIKSPGSDDLLSIRIQRVSSIWSVPPPKTDNFKLIEPIEAPLVPLSPQQTLTPMQEFIHKTLEQINTIEQTTSYHLQFNPTTRKWTFTDTIE